jgi:hypothetical protein
MSDFNTFVLLNMAFDLALIVAMSFLLAPKMPRLFGFLVVCNLLPYFLLLPLTEIPGMKSQKEEQPGYFELLDVARRPENIVGKNNVPPPRLQIPALFSAFTPPSSEIVPDESLVVEKPASTDSFVIQWIKALRHDPFALWIFLRIFWTAGALVVLLQHRLLGSGLAALQLLPLPFLIYAVPYGALYLVAQPTFSDVGSKLEDPSQIWDFLAPRFYTVLATLGAVILVVGAVVLMVVLSRRLSPNRLLMDTYLKPNKYRVRLNGNLLPFEVKGSCVIIEGIPFECRNLTVEERSPHIWLLNSNTMLEFVERENST